MSAAATETVTTVWAGVISDITARPLLFSAHALLWIACLLFTLSMLGVPYLLHRRKLRGSRAPLSLVGRAGVVERDLAPEGSVLVGGEEWRARTVGGVARRGAAVRVVGARGHVLEVEPEGFQ